MAWGEETVHESFLCGNPAPRVHCQALVNKIEERLGNLLEELWSLVFREHQSLSSVVRRNCTSSKSCSNKATLSNDLY